PASPGRPRGGLARWCLARFRRPNRGVVCLLAHGRLRRRRIRRLASLSSGGGAAALDVLVRSGVMEREREVRELVCAPGSDPRIEDYVDHVCALLVGRVEYAERAALRAELRLHLDALVAASREMGLETDAAVASALAQFGPPRDLAREWLCAWQRLQMP